MDLDFDWQEPWQPLDTDQAALLQQERQRELVPDHPLFEVKATAIARRRDSDDVLFRTNSPEAPFAIVHLTWRMKSEVSPEWPRFELYLGTQDLKGRLRSDTAEYERP